MVTHTVIMHTLDYSNTLIMALSLKGVQTL